MIVSTHGILASSGARDIASGYLFKSTTNSTVVIGTANTISYSNLITANTMLVGDFFQYQLNAVRSGANGSVALRVYFNTSASLTGATLVGTATVAASNVVFMSKIVMIKSATNTELNVVTGTVVTRDAQVNNVPIIANINWTVNQYFIIAFQPTSALDQFWVNGLFFLKT
tara:strand:+ start:313 stop:825 length:513 start_codon:yes stop_codon:yes gene_type:complete